MKDDMPHWRDPGSDLTDAERRVLGADAEFRPAAAERDAMWAALAPLVPPGGGAPASPTAGAPAAAAAGKVVSLTAFKAAIGIAAGVGIWFGGRAALHEDPAPETVRPVSVVEIAAPKAALVTQDPEQAVKDEGAVKLTQDASAPRRQTLPKNANGAGAKASASAAPATTSIPPAASAAPREAASRLQAEGEALDRARSALRRGDPDRAQRLLDEASSQFSGGMLVQERETLAVEALWASGKRDAARERARRFLKRYPASPLAARVRTYAR